MSDIRFEYYGFKKIHETERDYLIHYSIAERYCGEKSKQTEKYQKP